MNAYEFIRMEVSGECARITLNRPQRGNALIPQMLVELRNALGAAMKDTSVRVIVLTGEGKRFCTGADLSFMAQVSDPAVLMQAMKDLVAILTMMYNASKPIVGRINGDGSGGGSALALLCTHIVAVETAEFSTPEVTKGVFPAAIAGLLMEILGEGLAKNMIWFGYVLTAVEAANRDIIYKWVPPSMLDDEVDAAVQRLLSVPPAVLEGGQQLLSRIKHCSTVDSIARGAELSARLFAARSGK